ncbi:hypothetical protein RvY_18856 [Ramazzottius varieornatus]|uniref:TRAM domain-containing protein n=1 Tax=Ramazzottius varieornatus TaxID=947166 RepID=A0A1D1W7A7_RAMVA|nr:hypothetical protein RvY_18856 [Ramazzottius varieornatus]
MYNLKECHHLRPLRTAKQLFELMRRKQATASACAKEHSGAVTHRLPDGPDFQYFLSHGRLAPTAGPVAAHCSSGHGIRVFFEIHGCQMNTSDAEVVWSVLQKEGYIKVDKISLASIVLIMTCAIRESAEHKIWERLDYFKQRRRKEASANNERLKVGLLGCMAERLKDKILDKEKMVDVIAGPDSYRDLPRLLRQVESGQAAVNTLLSKEETYADIVPVHLTNSPTTAFVSIQRGCDNFCSFCIVPFVRGKERSRPVGSILNEVKALRDQGIREVTLLGQNVNSYCDATERSISTCHPPSGLISGFRTLYKPKVGGLRFVELLEQVSNIDPELRIRFQSPHPKDFPDEVIQLMRDRPNICKQLHLPAQSGSSQVLKAMRRGYTRQVYLDLVHRIRSIIPPIAFTSDFIAGFCGETEEAHKETLTLLKEVGYAFVYAYPYSMRPGTSADKRLEDNVSPADKNRRFKEVTSTFRDVALKLNQKQIGSRHLVLVEGDSKRSSSQLQGRADSGTKVIFPKVAGISRGGSSNSKVEYAAPQPGDYVEVLVQEASSQTLYADAVCLSSIQDFAARDRQTARRERDLPVVETHTAVPSN